MLLKAIEEFEREKTMGLTPGTTYLNGAELGRWLGVSRQRVNEVIKDASIYDRLWPDYVPIAEASKRIGYSYWILNNLAKLGKIDMVTIGRENYFNVSSYRPNICPKHGNPVPRYRSKWCGQECMDEEHKRLMRERYHRLKAK